MPGKRITVTSPQTRLAHARRRAPAAWRPPALHPEDVQRALTVYRGQRRAAVAPLCLLLVVLFGIPALLAAFPALDTVRLWGIPVSWLAMGVLPYPLLVLVARWQLRRAERVEDAEDTRR